MAFKILLVSTLFFCYNRISRIRLYCIHFTILSAPINMHVFIWRLIIIQCMIFDIQVTQIENLSWIINIFVDIFIYLWVHSFISLAFPIFRFDTKCLNRFQLVISFNALMHCHELVWFNTRRSTMAFSHFNIQCIQALFLNFLIILLDIDILIFSFTLRSINLCFLDSGQARLII